MKNITLNFWQRVGLMNVLGAATGPLAKITALTRVYEAVRLTDEEMQQVQIQDLGNGRSALMPPSPEWGTKTIEIEDADAKAVLAEIEAYSAFQISDMAWVNPIKAAFSQ